MEKFGGTTKLADTTKESIIFDHEAVTLEKYSINKDNEIKNQLEEEKIDPPIIIAYMESINTE